MLVVRPAKFWLRRKSTGDLMKDCGWDKLVKAANCVKEAEMKNLKVEMRQEPESKTGLAVQTIQVETQNLSVLDCTPEHVLENALAIIRRRPKVVTQQGTDNVGMWQLEFSTKERWENPCMGWSSSGDPLSNLSLCFRSCEDAVEFAGRRGWKIEIDDSNPAEKRKKILPKSYGEIFHWSRRVRASTK